MAEYLRASGIWGMLVLLVRVSTRFWLAHSIRRLKRGSIGVCG